MLLPRLCIQTLNRAIRFVPASAGVFFLVDLDSVMPKTGVDGKTLPDQERVDAAVSAILKAGVLLVTST